MRVVVTGGRGYKNRDEVWSVLERLDVGRVYVGDCPTGVDHHVRAFARRYRIFMRLFVADWSVGRSAGPMRNREMLQAAASAGINVLIAFPGGAGTADCVEQARTMGFTVLEITT